MLCFPVDNLLHSFICLFSSHIPQHMNLFVFHMVGLLTRWLLTRWLPLQAGVDAGGGALQPDRGTLDGILFDEADAARSMGASPATPAPATRAAPSRRTPVTGSSIDRPSHPDVDQGVDQERPASRAASEGCEGSVRDPTPLPRSSHTSLEQLFDLSPGPARPAGAQGGPVWSWLLQVGGGCT